ncbi:MAG TPA: glutathione S-transferase N-terminal domain-containing protein [Gammaproteobacteria bacterium]|nr:glutathione S-transferase N-terminal domain-containing protein [Gammaproteobacteria bacterium]
MAIASNKRSTMLLYTGNSDILSHRVRIALAEKGVIYESVNINPQDKEKSEDLLELNPYGTIPTLVDRDLALYDTNIIMEYLDERFPHPPLLPVYPVVRARLRLMIHRIDKEWGPIIRNLEQGKAAEVKAAAKELRAYLMQLMPLFTGTPYFLSDEFTLVDCCLAPILWRLPIWGIEFGNEAKALTRYTERLFKRESFQMSLTEVEKEIRKKAKAVNE